MTRIHTARPIFGLLAAFALVPAALAHGNVVPQPVDTGNLPKLGEEWLDENPYRAETAGEAVWAEAVRIGSSGYNQNCARCHGLEVISGGLAPDLRFLEADSDGDEWFVERFVHGYTQNGTTKMPAFGELLGQKAGWAIRTYIETRPDDGALDAHSDRLKEIRDALAAKAESGGADQAELDALRAEMLEIAGQVETGSGAEFADSVALRAAEALEKGAPGAVEAAEFLTIGLSAAH